MLSGDFGVTTLVTNNVTRDGNDVNTPAISPAGTADSDITETIHLNVGYNFFASTGCDGKALPTNADDRLGSFAGSPSD